MAYILTFLAGAIAGLLIYRKHSAKLSEAEAKARAAAGILKK